ncbi:DUF922 domain-containing Zn-dependent protease [Hoeflea olei]|uniref:DUF922 domain-containing Zn-dependent protease n=1 Tax=Hoeflea olei TaxID=1480615 RepID=UPI0008269DC2|nr:DUF922 domain-containing protein [Hoeflea olei]
MHPTRLVAAVLALCLAAGPGAAEPLIKKSYSYFKVSGQTIEDLESEFSKLGPMLQDTGNRHAGATRIKLGGSIDYESRKGRCRVIDAKVTLETHLILPRWNDRKRASPDMALVWDTLSSDIKRHEERHAEIARNYARELERALEALRPQRDCERMQARADAVTQRIIKRHAADQDRFDRVEAASYQRRMERLLRYKGSQRTGESSCSDFGPNLRSWRQAPCRTR